VDGVREEIAGDYVLKAKHQVGFQVAAYDATICRAHQDVDFEFGFEPLLNGAESDSPPRILVCATYRPLVIDPVLAYSTYLGGTSHDGGRDIAVDAEGNAYVTGITLSTNFPTENPSQPSHAGGGLDAFVTKLNSEGNSVIYSTYLGGSFTDESLGIAVDPDGNAYVTGRTGSGDFPTASPFQATFGGVQFDAFVTKLNSEGNTLVYSTYLGGSDEEVGASISVDADGNAYVVGTTDSMNFPTANPFQAAHGGGIFDAFVAKIADP
jgi:hypothetical protein